MRFIYTKTFILFIICLVVLVAGLFFQSRGWLQPIEYGLVQAPRPLAKVARSVSSPVKNFFSTLFTLRSIVRQNTDLTAKVANLQQQVVDIDQLKAENGLLKNELGFVQGTRLHLQPCTVLNIAPPELSDALIISCGEGEGIQEGQALIFQGYVIGTVLHVGKYSSTALLITNDNSAIDAKLSKNTTEGVAKGSFGSGVVFDMVSQNADVQKGDIVVTAGINSRIAKNLVIGEIGDVLSKSNDLFKKVSIVTPVRFHNIDYVFVAKQ
jgi:rod shape-determining protein MreC